MSVCKINALLIDLAEGATGPSGSIYLAKALGIKFLKGASDS